MKQNCIAVQLGQHAPLVRLGSPRTSPTKSGGWRGSCVLCLCCAGWCLDAA
ncbi:hypothetical protein FQN60_012367 [Etheostoma spectabile]|uniref:Uncharacterized protein n=1 Tax=Etheostoma spectabile TaxID=54343 RepID=A0A5J5DPP6_9PERO|nr:hypothetical protein FQN60_012367 [Etheostoma spectabile]